MATIMAAAVLGGCAAKREEIAYVPPERERYENCIEIEGQWGESAATGHGGQYGIGDPFVMRWNGKYYLYPSTSDPCDGIKVFESEDAVHWTDKGFAVAPSEATVHGAYAPEVVYYNGYFYLCQSRAGQGHYIYRSESPTDGFVLWSISNAEEGSIDYGNLGMGIDGSFYVSDDGKLYIMHTSTPAGLQFNEITDAENIRPETIGKAQPLGEANLRHWIEGPGIFRRGEYSYLTYTGNHVISDGYRVAYSYAKDLSDLSSFVQPRDNVTIIDTDADHRGLGHSSNFVGPDLDSIYTAYHSLVGNGPARRYNLDRYLPSGGLLTANGVTHRPVLVPAQPTASAASGDALMEKNGVFTLGSTQGYFTAEFNFVPQSGQKLCFGDKYCITLEDGTIALFKDGQEIAAKSIAFASDKINTVRVENGDGIGYIYLNNMRAIEYAAQASPGAVGYAVREGVQYTAFTNDVFGTSDFEAPKNFPTKFPATSYLKGEMRGFCIKGAEQVSGGVRVGEKQSIVQTRDDENAVCLAKGDWVKYAVDVPEDGMYSVSARVLTGEKAKLRIAIGESELIAEIDPASEAEMEAVNVTLGRMNAEKGVKAMKVEVLSGKAGIILFDVRAGAEMPQNVSVSAFQPLSGDVSVGETVRVSGGDVPGAAHWGNAGITDFETELTFCLSANADAGFMLRENYYSWFTAQPKQSWRGYYLQFTGQIMTLRRFDYGDEMLVSARAPSVSDGNAHTVKVSARNGTLSVILDGNSKLEYTDDHAFTSGYLGVYSAAGQIELLDFTYNILK